MYDMFSSGAVAFTDDKKSVENAGLMLRALMYAKNFGGLVIQLRTRSIDCSKRQGE
jgi:dihydroorotase